MGKLLPVKETKFPVSKESSGLRQSKLFVSNLNASTLQDLAHIQIIWIDTISAHLDFDPTIPSVKLFRLPSFCKLHMTVDSVIKM